MNTDTFKQVVLPHYRTLYAVAVTLLRDRDYARDAVQDTVAQMWEIRDTLDTVGNIEAFCVSAVKHRCLDVLRSFHLKMSERSQDSASYAGLSDDMLRRVDARDDLRRVNRLMSCLSEDQRKVLSLSAFNGLSNKEIAEVTGFKDENVRSLLSRARKRIREMF